MCVSLLPRPLLPPIFHSMQIQGEKACEISSRAMMSGRQKIDTPFVFAYWKQSKKKIREAVTAWKRCWIHVIMFLFESIGSHSWTLSTWECSTCFSKCLSVLLILQVLTTCTILQLTNGSSPNPAIPSSSSNVSTLTSTLSFLSLSSRTIVTCTENHWPLC